VKKLLNVAGREFWATVTSRGFLIAIMMVPALLAATFVLLPRLIREEPPVLSGELALIDRTHRVAQTISRKIAEAGEGRSGFKLRVRELSAESSLENEKHALIGDGPRLALAVIDSEAIDNPRQKAGSSSYRLFVRNKLDYRVEHLIENALHDSIVEERARAQGLDPARIQELVNVGRSDALTVTAGGEHALAGVLHAVLPLIFMMLLFMSVMVSGQNLMTTTIEEKSSRVIEVLLSAVSPLELMAGKIVGQLGVGLLVLSVYGAVGLWSLKSHALLELLEPSLVVYLLLFFLIAYFVVAALMAAIGAAVSELRDAQALLTPVVLILMLPWLLAAPISSDPDSALSVTLSFLPPLNSFAMLLRVASTNPPPVWQIWLSIAIGFASVVPALWFAAKVFRIGLLLHGKPPSFATLVRWVREA